MPNRKNHYLKLKSPGKVLKLVLSVSLFKMVFVVIGSKTNTFKLHNKLTNVEDLDEQNYARNGPIEVHTRIIFSRMGTINTVDEKFDCHAFVECYWDDDNLYAMILQDANLEKNSGVQLKNRLNEYLDEFTFDPNKYWTPRTYFENALGEIKTEKTYKIQAVKKPSYLNVSHTLSHMMTIRVFEQKFIRGVFHEVKFFLNHN
jgi:hypothetical protein